MTYNTSQRRAVLTLLEKCDTHLTAEEIAATLKSNGKSVGLTTVYRHLSALVKEGSVRKFEAEGGSGYQYVGDHSACHEHLHFKCADCGRLFCVDCHLFDEISEHMKNDHNFILDSRQTVFYGRCTNCEEKR